MAARSSPEEMVRLPHWSAAVRQAHVVVMGSGRAAILLGACGAPVAWIALLNRIAEAGPSALQEPSSAMSVLALAYPFVVALAPAWALLVWHGEARGERDYVWSTPLSRPVADLSRVVVGALWLVFALALVDVFARAVDSSEAATVGRLLRANLLSAALTTYLAACILPLATRRPLEWGTGIAVATACAAFLAVYFVPAAAGALRPALSGSLGLITALRGGYDLGLPTIAEFNILGAPAGGVVPLETWITASGLWLTVAVTGVLVAVRRAP